MNTQTKHEESGCTDYLQHSWEGCPCNPKRRPVIKPLNGSDNKLTAEYVKGSDFSFWQSV